MTKIAVLHAVNDLHPVFGGPSRSVSQLCEALAVRGDLDITLLFHNLAGAPITDFDARNLVTRVVDASPHRSILGLAVRRAIAEAADAGHFAIIHGHGIWQPVNHWVAEAARRHRIPHIIHPRGMLTAWAINHRLWKKRLALALYQRRDLETATMFVATSKDEGDDLRAFGLKQPIAVIPNVVALASAQGGENESAGSEPRRMALFLSRIHEKKGLLYLTEAWERLCPPGWELVIAGPGEGSYLVTVKERIQALQGRCAVRYVGEVDGEDKARLFRSADVFVLPTLSENFGIVVAEALSHGVPVVTTKGAPWSALETHDCGWWVDIGTEPLMGALREAMALTDEQRRAKGENGRAYVRRFDAQAIAEATAEVYRWILSGGSRSSAPGCVRLD